MEQRLRKQVLLLSTALGTTGLASLAGCLAAMPVAGGSDSGGTAYNGLAGANPQGRAPSASAPGNAAPHASVSPPIMPPTKNLKGLLGEPAAHPGEAASVKEAGKATELKKVEKPGNVKQLKDVPAVKGP